MNVIKWFRGKKYKMIIDKDFLTEDNKQKVYTLCSSPEVPWYFIKTTTTYNQERNNVLNDERTKENFQFIHTLRGDETIFSSYYDYIHNEVFLKFLNKHKIKCKSILRAKLNFVSSINQNENVYQSPHVDYRFPHKVFLYYVNDSDGNTFLFNEKYNGEKQTLTVANEITPEMGKAICFDGLTYHAPSSPKKSQNRIVINIAFIEDKE
jgi:hypothetical protein